MAKENKQIDNELNSMMFKENLDIGKSVKKPAYDKDKLEDLNSKTKVIGIRILKEDLDKVKRYIRMETGENSLSAGIRKILYNGMEKKGLFDE